MSLLGKPLLEYKHNRLTATKAIKVYLVVFKTLQPILKGNAKPRDTNTDEFNERMVSILNGFQTGAIGIWTAVDEIVDCFTTENTAE